LLLSQTHYSPVFMHLSGIFFFLFNPIRTALRTSVLSLKFVDKVERVGLVARLLI
jgi:hypothetical protein